MDRTLGTGATGANVRELQSLLNGFPPTKLSALSVDGIFGPKTRARVMEFQRNNGLQVDGIVGSKTWARLRSLQVPVAFRTGSACGNGNRANQANALSISNSVSSTLIAKGSQLRFAGIGGPSAVALLPNILPSFRALTLSQIATATATYGSSLDFSCVFISDKTGAGNLPFTVVVPATPFSPTIQIMNCGNFAPPPKLLIHELAHVWQSQHHSIEAQFMLNSVQSQALAISLNGAAAVTDPRLASNSDFPSHFPLSAYAFLPVPGKAFGDFAAEQIANAVENDVSAIVSHVKSVAPGAIDSANVTSLNTARVGDRRVGGTVF